MNDLDMLQWLLSLLIVVVVIVLFAWLARKSRVFGSTHQQLKVVATMPLGQKERLMVVDVGGEQVLLGVTGQQINLLKTLDEPMVAASAEQHPFAEKLALLMKQKHEK